MALLLDWRFPFVHKFTEEYVISTADMRSSLHNEKSMCCDAAHTQLLENMLIENLYILQFMKLIRSLQVVNLNISEIFHMTKNFERSCKTCRYSRDSKYGLRCWHERNLNPSDGTAEHLCSVQRWYHSDCGPGGKYWEVKHRPVDTHKQDSTVNPNSKSAFTVDVRFIWFCIAFLLGWVSRALFILN